MPNDIEVMVTNPDSPTAEEGKLLTGMLARISLGAARVFGRGVTLDSLLSAYCNLAVTWVGKERAAAALDSAKSNLDAIELLQRKAGGNA